MNCRCVVAGTRDYCLAVVRKRAGKCSATSLVFATATELLRQSASNISKSTSFSSPSDGNPAEIFSLLGIYVCG